MDAQFVQPLPAAAGRSPPGCCRSRRRPPNRGFATRERVPNVFDHQQIPPAAGHRRQCHVEAEQPGVLLPFRAEVKAAVEVLRLTWPKSSRFADRQPRIGPIKPAGQTRIGQQVRGPDFVGGKTVVRAGIARSVRRPGSIPAAGVRSSAGRNPAGAGRPVPPARRRRGRRTRPAGPVRGGKTPPADYRRPVRIGWEARASKGKDTL